MDSVRKAVLIYFVVRCIVLCTSVPQALMSVIELSTPISSFPRLEEGVYLYNVVHTSPYDGGVFHQSPLLLILFTSLPRLLWPLVFITADVYGALSLARYAQRFRNQSYSPLVITLVYLLNPFSLSSSLAQSTNVLTNALICGALSSAVENQTGLSMMLMSLSTVLGWYPLYLMPCIVHLNRTAHAACSLRKMVAVFSIGVAAFLGISYLPLLSWQFVGNQFGTLFFLKDLTQPNIGLWWYFFIEMFTFFRPFFLGAFQLFILSFPMPLLIRFPKQPLFIVGNILGFMAIFKPYPEASDLGLYLSILVLDKQVFELMEYRFFEALGLIHVILLGPVFYYLWIFVGSGNANFFYAITLVYAVALILVLADSMWAAVRIDYDGGKSTKITQI